MEAVRRNRANLLADLNRLADDDIPLHSARGLSGDVSPGHGSFGCGGCGAFFIGIRAAGGAGSLRYRGLLHLKQVLPLYGVAAAVDIGVSDFTGSVGADHGGLVRDDGGRQLLRVIDPLRG